MPPRAVNFLQAYRLYVSMTQTNEKPEKNQIFVGEGSPLGDVGGADVGNADVGGADAGGVGVGDADVEVRVLGQDYQCLS